MKFGIALGALNINLHTDAVDLADQLGFESVWMPEHLVLPVHMTRSPLPGQDHPPIPAKTPVLDAFGVLSFYAGRTRNVRLATHVYNLGLRHPFVAARAVATLDWVSKGRAIVGLGASWLESEWDAVGLDFKSRGRRFDEALGVCKRLWSEDVVAHHGEFFDFDDVMFEPKPIQKPYPPIIIGGVSEVALRRAARTADGWVGMGDTFENAPPRIERLRELLIEAGRDPMEFDITIGGKVDGPDDVERWRDIGATRLVVSPWQRSREALDGMKRFAEWAVG